MKLPCLFPLLALLLAAGLHAENTCKGVHIASPWPAQNTIIAILGYSDNIVGTSVIAERVPLLRQSLLCIEKVVVVSVDSGHEINSEQIIALGVDMPFVPQDMVVPQQALLKQVGVQVLAFETNSLRALTQRVQQTAAMLGPDTRQKALAYRRYFDRNVALVTGRLKDLPASQRMSFCHSIGNPLTTTGRPSLNQGWINLAGGKNITENWLDEHQQNRSDEAALEKIVTVNPAVIITINKRGMDVTLSSSQWTSVDTITHRRVYINPKGVFWWCRETNGGVLQFLQLAKTLYPTRFVDVDMCKETYESYRQFFGLTLGDVQMSDVLNPPC